MGSSHSANHYDGSIKDCFLQKGFSSRFNKKSESLRCCYSVTHTQNQALSSFIKLQYLFYVLILRLRNFANNPSAIFLWPSATIRWQWSNSNTLLWVWTYIHDQTLNNVPSHFFFYRVSDRFPFWLSLFSYSFSSHLSSSSRLSLICLCQVPDPAPAPLP